MNNKEKQLLELGFKKDYEFYYLFKYGNQYWVSNLDIEEDENEEWTLYIENIKESLKEAKIKQGEDELYILGYNSAKKEIKQKILGIKNKYKSQNKEETIPKLGRTINAEKEYIHKIRMEIIKEIESKL